jgi:hypothetical protein
MNGHNAAEGFLIGSEDVSGSRIQLRSLLLSGGPAGLLVQGQTNTRVNIYGLQDSSYQAFRVTGIRSSAPSQVACFGCGMGGSSVSLPVLSVSQVGNLLMEDTWFEGSSGGMANLSGAAANVTIQGNIFAPYNTLPAAITLDNYSGNFVWMSSYFNEQSGPIVVTTPTSNTNVLVMGTLFMQNPFWRVESGGNVYGRDNDIYGSTGSAPTPDLGGTPSAAFMRTILNQVRTVLPSPNTRLPSGVSDVQIDKVWIESATTSVHVVREGGTQRRRAP